MALAATATACSPPDHHQAVPPTHSAEPTGGSSSPHAFATQQALVAQAEALRRRDRAGYLAGWATASAAQQTARRTYANLLHLGVAAISPRLDLASIREARTGWTAVVAVAWRLPGFDRTAATATLRYSFDTVAGVPVIAGLAVAADGREPVWLLPHLDVVRGPRTLVAATSSTVAARVDRLLRKAVTAVGRVLPHWKGALVAYAPGSAAQFEALIAAGPDQLGQGQYGAIAAVTTSVDGSQQRAAPTAIVVNPAVFAGLGPVGAWVVIAHEATHVATHAAAASMPLWLAEGFADYVGIGSVSLPLAVAAKAALRAVRRNGAPADLPADSAFALGGRGLEATYEEAWLATSLIARTHGRAGLVALYRAVERRPDDLAGAFSRVLHTTVPQFTASWRGYLERAAAGAR